MKLSIGKIIGLIIASVMLAVVFLLLFAICYLFYAEASCLSQPPALIKELGEIKDFDTDVAAGFGTRTYSCDVTTEKGKFAIQGDICKNLEVGKVINKYDRPCGVFDNSFYKIEEKKVSE